MALKSLRKTTRSSADSKNTYRTRRGRRSRATLFRAGVAGKYTSVHAQQKQEHGVGSRAVFQALTAKLRTHTGTGAIVLSDSERARLGYMAHKVPVTTDRMTAHDNRDGNTVLVRSATIMIAPGERPVTMSWLVVIPGVVDAAHDVIDEMLASALLIDSHVVQSVNASIANVEFTADGLRYVKQADDGVWHVHHAAAVSRDVGQGPLDTAAMEEMYASDRAVIETALHYHAYIGNCNGYASGSGLINRDLEAGMDAADTSWHSVQGVLRPIHSELRAIHERLVAAAVRGDAEAVASARQPIDAIMSASALVQNLEIARTILKTGVANPPQVR